jgi:integrase/recombinase XerD
MYTIVYSQNMPAPHEVEAVLTGLELRKRHSLQCQTDNDLRNCWQPLSDKRKRCRCVYWSCGVHDRAAGFQRISTGEITLERAQAVARLRIETGNRLATLATDGKPINEAIDDFMSHTSDRGAKHSSLQKYQTLMDQLQAFSDWRGYRYVHELDQDAVQEFRRSWEDASAGYKQNRTNQYGKPLWRAQSVSTCKRNRKTLSGFFRRCIARKWITEDPTTILGFPKEASKTKEDVKYLSPDQLRAILAECDKPGRTRGRLKALVLTMRWTGLRISDAVALNTSKIVGGNLHVITKKASAPVLIPIHSALNATLSKLTPYPGGYFFWNNHGGKPSTVQSNYGKQLADTFQNAGIQTDSRHVSHMLRNTFAVDLLERGIPLETVSLLLGHKSVTTTERYYADFTRGHMERVAAWVRKVWAGEALKLE